MADTSYTESPLDWCDATRSLLDAPDGDRIERHAVELISRALNSRPVVAFVGAGASMAYGRLSWKDAVLVMQERSLAEEYNIDKNYKTQSAALEILKRQKISPSDDTSSDHYLVAFQLTEQFSKTLLQNNNFRNQVKLLLLDDFGHAALMVSQSLEDSILNKVDPQDRRFLDNDIRLHSYAVIAHLGSGGPFGVLPRG